MGTRPSGVRQPGPIAKRLQTSTRAQHTTEGREQAAHGRARKDCKRQPMAKRPAGPASVDCHPQAAAVVRRALCSSLDAASMRSSRTATGWPKIARRGPRLQVESGHSGLLEYLDPLPWLFQGGRQAARPPCPAAVQITGCWSQRLWLV